MNNIRYKVKSIRSVPEFGKEYPVITGYVTDMESESSAVKSMANMLDKGRVKYTAFIVSDVDSNRLVNKRGEDFSGKNQ